MGKYCRSQVWRGNHSLNQLFKLEDSTGTLYLITGTKMLSSLFKHVKTNDKLQIVYKGKVPSPSSGYDYRYYELSRLVETWQDAKPQKKKVLFGDPLPRSPGANEHSYHKRRSYRWATWGDASSLGKKANVPSFTYVL